MEKTNSVLMEVQFCPPISYFRVLLDHPVLYLEIHENYQKRSYRNRCEIAGPHGKQTLSVPLVKGKNQKTPIRDVKISQTQPWQKEMWHALEAAYRKSPFFEFYESELHAVLMADYQFLYDLNRALLEKLIAWVGLDVRIAESTSFRIAGEATTNLTDCIRPSKNKVLAPADFPAYTQVFSASNEFLPDLSILDLLFNKGPESILYLKLVGSTTNK